MNEIQRPKVGIGVYVRKNGKVLLGKRISHHGTGTWSAPGGHLEMYESWEECAKRETLEEVGIEIENVRFLTATNDIFVEEGKHYITLNMVADWKSGEVENKEPEKHESWDWFAWDELPEPKAVYLSNLFKLGYNPLNFPDNK